jgi:energy-coupling factor transporter ATP-binding protein EcfA2
MPHNDGEAAPDQGGLAKTQSPAQSTTSPSLYVEAERLHRSDLAIQYGPDEADWPEYKRPDSPEYQRMTAQHVEWLEQLAEDAAATPLPLAEPAGRLPTDVAAPLVQVDRDAAQTDYYVRGAAGRLLSPDPRIEAAIPQRLAEATARHRAGRHNGFREAHCADCCAEQELRRWPDFGDLERGQLVDMHRSTAEDRVRAFLLSGGRFADNSEVRAPAAEPAAAGRLVAGSAFLAESTEETEPLWGTTEAPAWMPGEALLLAGPPGVGKSTMSQQLIRAMIGETATEVLGMPVALADLVIYGAHDRPAQIARSMRRMFADVDPATLDERLVVHSGPLAHDVAARPQALLDMVLEAAGGSVAGRRVVLVVDSLKDVAAGLVEDVGGAGYNRARQLVLAAGVEVLELHHLTKRGPNGTKPTTLADVYGSMHLTAGAGSVVLLWGAAGDPVVELHHLKQPAGEIGPLQVVHDHARGVSTLVGGADLLTVLSAKPEGLTAKAAACHLFSVDKPTSAQTEKARRRLDELVDAQKAYRNAPAKGSNQATVWTVLGGLM